MEMDRYSFNKNLNNVDVPTKYRRCTDVLFLILFVISFASITLVGLAATGHVVVPYITKGDPLRLVHGVDFIGNTCGVDDAVLDYQYLWRPNFLGGNTADSVGTVVSRNFGICVDACPLQGDEIADPYGIHGTWTVPVNTKRVVGFCLPLNSERQEQLFNDVFGDLMQAARVICILGFVSASVISLLFFILIRIPYMLRLLVWSAVFLITIGLGVGGYFIIVQSQSELYYITNMERTVMFAIGIVLMVCALFWMCTMLYLRGRISLSIILMKEAAKVLLQLPLLYLSPILSTCFAAAASVGAAVVMVYIAAGSQRIIHEENSDSVTVQYFDQKAIEILIATAVVWYWTIQFIDCTGQLVTSHAVLTWYFSPHKLYLSSCQVIDSYLSTIRYHLGTAALGAFTVTILGVLRSIIAYMRSWFRAPGHNNNPLSNYARGCFDCCSYCVSCMDYCLRILNKNAFIQCSLRGAPFCSAANEAFQLFIRNMGRVATTSFVGELVVFVGRMTVMILSAGIGYYYMRTEMADELSSFIIPAFVIAEIASITAGLYLEVLTTCYNTIIQAHLVDEELFHGAHSDESLRQFVAMSRMTTIGNNDSYNSENYGQSHIVTESNPYHQRSDLPSGYGDHILTRPYASNQVINNQSSSSKFDTNVYGGRIHRPEDSVRTISTFASVNKQQYPYIHRPNTLS